MHSIGTDHIRATYCLPPIHLRIFFTLSQNVVQLTNRGKGNRDGVVYDLLGGAQAEQSDSKANRGNEKKRMSKTKVSSNDDEHSDVPKLATFPSIPATTPKQGSYQKKMGVSSKLQCFVCSFN